MEVGLFSEILTIEDMGYGCSKVCKNHRGYEYWIFYRGRPLQFKVPVVGRLKLINS
jgi:hypothetical protein